MSRPQGTDLDPDDGGIRQETGSTRVKRLSDSGSDSGTDESPGELDRKPGPAWFRSATPEPSTPSSVARIGRFEVIELLGKGAFGEVWLVHDPLLDRPRAMKLPRFGAVESGSTRTRFFREAKAIAALDHRNVVRVFEADEVGPVCFFLIMEYCPAGSLAAWLANRPEGRVVPPRWAAEFVASLADGVAHAHSRGLLHRDLKPSNVLLVVEETEATADAEADAEGLPRFVPKVADFGLVKILDEPDGSDQTASDALVGTLAYMAPEQASRNPSRISAATDVYGLGAILYELLAGRRPFVGLDQVELIDHILRQEPRPLPDGLPVELETISRKCLAKAPADRYATAADLATDLRRWLAGEPIRARRAPVWKKAQAWSRRHPIRLAALGLMGLALAGLCGWLEARARQEATGWLDRLGNANVLELPGLVRLRKADDPRIVPGVARLFQKGTADQKLAAAVFLAPGRTDCAEHAVDRLLTIEPGAVKPLCRALDGRLASLAATLEKAIAAPAPVSLTLAQREGLDRRRSRASTALILLGQGDPGWRLLQFAPDPQARSFLVHDLGPSGVEPATILDRLEAEPDASSRRALILSLGEVPETRWPDALRKRAAGRLLAIYRDDPDRGIHGAARWLLKRWRLEKERQAEDIELARRPESNPPAEWRVAKSGLTFVTLPDLKGGRLVEILDTEVTREVFERLRPEHRTDLNLSPDLDGPANSITYHDAAGFCERLNELESLPLSYRRSESPTIGPKYQSLPDILDRPGYRLVTVDESYLACQAGTSTGRFFGESDALLPFYAWIYAPGRNQLYPVASLKPNDYGFFDLLGNAAEVAQSSKLPMGKNNPAAIYGGGSTSQATYIRWDYCKDGIEVGIRYGVGFFGFRVARTRSVRNQITAR